MPPKRNLMYFINVMDTLTFCKLADYDCFSKLNVFFCCSMNFEITLFSNLLPTGFLGMGKLTIWGWENVRGRIKN